MSKLTDLRALALAEWIMSERDNLTPEALTTSLAQQFADLEQEIVAAGGSDYNIMRAAAYALVIQGLMHRLGLERTIIFRDELVTGDRFKLLWRPAEGPREGIEIMCIPQDSEPRSGRASAADDDTVH